MSTNTPWYSGPVGELKDAEEYEDEMDVDTKTLLKIQSLVESLNRRSYKLSDYNLLIEEAQDDKDDKDDKDDELEEFSGAGGGGIAGYTGPLTKQTPRERKDLLKVSTPYASK